MQGKRHDRVVEMRLCFFSGKVGDYKVPFKSTRKCRSTINRVEKVGYVRRILEQTEKEPQPEEKSESPAKPTTETVAEYPAVENGLPYDIVVEKIRFDEPEHEQPRKTPVTAKPSAHALSADRRNYRITDDALGVGGAKDVVIK